MTRALDIVRVVLGLILLLTAIRYFMPFLMPFVELPQWEDPMSARLMASFEVSGLLGVAKFIHLVAGLALLLNRSVPFALAAALPVNVCAAFIAVLVEGAVLGGLLALAVLALNGLLMFAYLPAYRGVLEASALADGEGPEPGEHYNSVLANPFGGAPRKACLLAALPLLAALAFYWKVVPGASSMTGLVTLLIPVVVLGVNVVRARP